MFCLFFASDIIRIVFFSAQQGITKKQRLSLCFFLVNLYLLNYHRHPNQADLHVYLVHINGFKSKGVYIYLKDSLSIYLSINNKKYIKTKSLQLIIHNNNWRKTSQNINKYVFK